MGIPRISTLPEFASGKLNNAMRKILYSGTKNASSWAFRAWLALKEAGVEFEEQVVDIRKPQRFENLAKIQAFSPPGAVPVLVDGDIVIYDSLAIMEYANELSAGKLLPADIEQRAQVCSLVAWQHAGLSNLCPRLSFESSFYPDRRKMVADEVTGAQRIFDVWESELGRSGGPYLAGELSLADLAFAPTVLRLCTHMRSWEQWPLTSNWIERLLSRPAVQEWLLEAHSLPAVRLDGY
ncbi:MAG: glutathione S-transferase family protein [Pseudoxanthomonas sp.]